MARLPRRSSPAAPPGGPRHKGGRSARRRHSAARRAAGFTLVELMVVIVIIGLLVALLVTVGARVVGSQKVATTRNTMRLIGLAIEQFAQTNPLAALYDNPQMRAGAGQGQVVGRSFGPYPPYPLDNHCQGLCFPPATVAQALESVAVGGDNRLSDRLWRDLGNERGSKDHWVGPDFGDNNLAPAGDIRGTHGDIRALYCYLAAFTPGVLSQVPEAAMKPLPHPSGAADRVEIINPTGQGTNPDDAGAVQVKGFYDAWGVPLDYMLYVKLEWTIDPQQLARWMVTDRIPVLRSRGIAEEQVGSARDVEGRWLFSEPFPQPAVTLDHGETGRLHRQPPADGRFNGWARVRPDRHEDDDPTYVPP